MKNTLEHIIRLALSEQATGKEKRQQRRQARQAPKETEFGVEPGREPLLVAPKRDPFNFPTVDTGVGKANLGNNNTWYQPYVVLRVPPIIKKYKVVPMSRRGMQVAKDHGAVLKGWPAFTIKTVYTRGVGEQALTGKYNEKYLRLMAADEDDIVNLPDLEVGPDGKSLQPKKYDATVQLEPITDSQSALNTLEKIWELDNSKQSQYYVTEYGSGGDIPEYVYILSNNISKRSRVRKFNVWVCNYKQLHDLTVEINKKEPVQYHIEPARTSGQRNVLTFGNNIAVLSFTDAAKWFNALDTYLSKNPEFNISPKNSKVLIPELQYLNVDYDTESDEDLQKTMSLKGKTVKITNAEEASKLGFDSRFTGTAQYDYSPEGQLILIPIEGTHRGVSRHDDGTLGDFTGRFKNGAPINGVVEWKDGERWEGELYSTVYVRPDGKRGYTFSKTNNTTVTKTKVEIPKLTYPRDLVLPDRTQAKLITTSNADPYVYWKDKETWWFVDKSGYEQWVYDSSSIKLTPTAIPAENKKSIGELNAILEKL